MLNCIKIHIQLDPVLDHPHVEHDALFCAGFDIAHGQDRGLLEGAKNLRRLRKLVPTHIEHLAIFQLINGAKSFDRQGPAFDGFFSDGIQARSKWIAPQYADHQWGSAGSEDAVRPFDKFCKVEEECSFEQIFPAGILSVRACGRA